MALDPQLHTIGGWTSVNPSYDVIRRGAGRHVPSPYMISKEDNTEMNRCEVAREDWLVS